MLCYKLSNNIDANRLVMDIQKLINKKVKENKEYLLVIKVQEINSNDDEIIPKLTHTVLENS